MEFAPRGLVRRCFKALLPITHNLVANGKVSRYKQKLQSCISNSVHQHSPLSLITLRTAIKKPGASTG